MYGLIVGNIFFPTCIAVISLVGMYFWIRKEVTPSKRNKGKVVVQSSSPHTAPQTQKEETDKRSKRQIKKNKNREKERDKITEVKREKEGMRSPISIDLEVVDMN